MNAAAPSIETIRAALAFVPADLPRDEWARVAMALKAELGAEGFDLFSGWSKTGEKYSARATRDTWRSVKAAGGVTIGTLLHLAQSHGFRFGTMQTPALSADESAARGKARRDAEERERSERAAAECAAAAEAARLWARAEETGDSSYLQRKRVKAHGVRFGDGALLVPMRDVAGELHNLQRILPAKPADGPDKLFLRGGRTRALMHWCGDPSDAAVLLVAEGYATAATLHEATGRPAAAAFTAGNLSHVVRAIRARHRSARVLVCGDDDRDTEAHSGRNPGREKADAAARLIRGRAVFPAGLPEGGSDFNDLAAHAGADAVREIVEKALQAAEATAEASTQGRGEKGASRAGKAPSAGNGATTPADADRFRVDDDGVWYAPPNDEEGRVRRICDPLFVVAKARDVHGNGWCLVLEFDSPDTRSRRWLMPLAMLAGDGAEYRRELLSMGFSVPSDANRRRWLTEYLQSRRPTELARIVDRVGWHGRAYVLPRKTLGENDDGERILFQSDAPAEDTFKQRGTLGLWQERVGRLCIGNSRLLFAASCAFAGPLLHWSGLPDGGVFHLVGDSSCGKTTALRVAASVWGGREYLQRWRATDNGIEAQAAQHSDALLVLDELAQLDPKVAGESAYMLANGQGKARAGRSGAARPRLAWRLLVLSAGEVGLADHMAEANKRRTAGQELRMIDLPADAGAAMGLFEATHGREGPGALALHLVRACEATHGTPGRAWLEWLTNRTESLGRTLRERMDKIAGQVVPEAAAGQVQRAGRRFALVAAAGEMAAEAGLTGWPKGDATAAVRRCFDAWIAARAGGIGISEETQMVRQARQWFGLHGEARFTDWTRADDDHAPKTMNRAGWRKPVKSSNGLDELLGWEWYVLIDAFRAEVCKGFNYKAVQRLLAERGHLVPAHGNHYAHTASPPGADRCQVYRVKSSILSEPD